MKRTSILYLFLIQQLFAGCFQKIPVKTNEVLHVEIDRIRNKELKNLQTFTCSKTRSNLNKKFSYRIKVREESLHYFFYCKPTVVGRALSLKIYYNDRLVQLLDSVASKVRSGEVEYRVNAWLKDINEDGYLDFVQRSYSLNDPLKDMIRVSFWDRDEKSMIKQDLSEETLLEYKLKFKVSK